MVERVARIFASISLFIGAFSMAVMAVLTVADVFMRYVFKSPLPGTGEHTQLLLAVIVFSGLVLVTREGTHIVVSLCESLLNRAVPGLYSGLYLLANVIGLLLILYTLFEATRDMYEYEEASLVMDYPLVYLGIILTVFVILSIAQLPHLKKQNSSSHSTSHNDAVEQ